MSPATVLKLFIHHLSPFEQGEILDYPKIWWLGKNAKKIKSNIKEGKNYGYDDERGDYNIVTGDHIAYRYEIVDMLGKGTFGQVKLG